MVDSFSLAGRGPIRLHAGFVAIFTNDAGTFHFEPLHSHGDPIKFTDPAGTHAQRLRSALDRRRAASRNRSRRHG